MKRIIPQKIACASALALLCFAGTAATAQDIESGLEGYWPFDAFENGAAPDSSGNGYDAVVDTGPAFPAAGVIGNALDFDGTGDLTAPWKGVLGNEPRTISLWVKTTDTGNGMVGWGANNPGEKWHFRINSDSANGVVGAIRTEFAGSQNVATTLVNDGQWHHVVSVFEGEFPQDVIHYVDGELDPRSWVGAQDIPINTTEGDDVSLGSRIQGGTHNIITGTLDDVRIYSRALTPEDIRALYELGLEPRPAASRSFDSASVMVGGELNVTLILNEGAAGLLTETLPDGWTVTEASGGGAIDGNTVQWDIAAGTAEVSYTATPGEAAAETAGARFTGDLDGLITDGDTTVSLIQNGAGDFGFNADIGDVAAAGGADFDGTTYFVSGSGADIYNTADEFHFLWREVSGPFNLRALVFPDPFESLSDTVKTGPMIRQDAAPDSPFMMGFIRTQFDQQSNWRTAPGEAAQAGTVISLEDQDLTGRIELRRRGDIIQTWFELGDGSWFMHASAEIPGLQDPVLAGLAVTSHEDGALSIGEFTEVEFEQVDFTAFRSIDVPGGGSPGFGETLTVAVEIFQNESGDLSVTETPPAGWAVSGVSADSGEAAFADGVIEWNAAGFQGTGTLTYNLQTPPGQTEPSFVGQFEGTANGNEIRGAAEITVKGLLPDEILSQEDIDTGLIGHWTFDEGSGASAADSSAAGRDAEIWSGDPAWVPGVKGTALEFDGDDALYTPDWYGIGGGAPRTVTAWIQSTATNTHGIVSWGLSSGSGQKYHVRINDNAGNGTSGALRTEIQDSFNIATTVINDGQWHFIASVFTEEGEVMTDVIHYVDGHVEAMSGTNGNGPTLVLDTAADPAVSDIRNSALECGCRVGRTISIPA